MPDACPGALPESPEYLPFAPGPFRLQMGVKPLDLAEWIEIDRHYPAEWARKNQLLREHHDEIAVGLPESEPAARETRSLVWEHLVRRFPRCFSAVGDRWRNELTGESGSLAEPSCPPLEQAARWVQEDLCLMEPGPEGYRLTGAVVAFPSRWRVREKLGQSLRGIHGPVYLYPEQLAAGVDRFFEVLTVDRPVWRVNWNVHETPELFQLAGTGRSEPDATITPTNAGERLWLRLERQTLRRLPASGAVLFTIRTYVRPISDYQGRPTVAAQLAGAVRAMPPETVAYKSLGIFRDALLSWLDIAAAAG